MSIMRRWVVIIITLLSLGLMLVSAQTSRTIQSANGVNFDLPDDLTITTDVLLDDGFNFVGNGIEGTIRFRPATDETTLDDARIVLQALIDETPTPEGTSPFGEIQVFQLPDGSDAYQVMRSIGQDTREMLVGAYVNTVSVTIAIQYTGNLATLPMDYINEMLASVESAGTASASSQPDIPPNTDNDTSATSPRYPSIELADGTRIELEQLTRLYVADDLQIQLNYPQGWRLSSDDRAITFDNDNQTIEGTITITGRDDSSLEDDLEAIAPLDSWDQIIRTNLNGYPAIRAVRNDDTRVSTHVLIVHQSKLLITIEALGSPGLLQFFEGLLNGVAFTVRPIGADLLLNPVGRSALIALDSLGLYAPASVATSDPEPTRANTNPDWATYTSPDGDITLQYPPDQPTQEITYDDGVTEFFIGVTDIDQFENMPPYIIGMTIYDDEPILYVSPAWEIDYIEEYDNLGFDFGTPQNIRINGYRSATMRSRTPNNGLDAAVYIIEAGNVILDIRVATPAGFYETYTNDIRSILDTITYNND